jgi:hypothetical protein
VIDDVTLSAAGIAGLFHESFRAAALRLIFPLMARGATVVDFFGAVVVFGETEDLDFAGDLTAVLLDDVLFDDDECELEL